MHTRRMVTIHRNRDKKVSQNYSSSKDSPHSFFNTHSYLIDYIDYNNVDRFIEENNKVFVKHTYNKVAIKHFGIFRMSQDFNCTRYCWFFACFSSRIYGSGWDCQKMMSLIQSRKIQMPLIMLTLIQMQLIEYHWCSYPISQQFAALTCVIILKLLKVLYCLLL